jgi:hypothetical protein
MEMLISNTVIYFTVCALTIWGILCVVALALISLRKDQAFIYDDMNKFLLRDRYEYRLISTITLFVILPISIPYSIMHILKK